MTLRRLKLSAIAPETSANSMIGRAVDACTNATMSADDEMMVIIHAAPTVWIREPRLVARLASQIDRNIRCWKGARVGKRSITTGLAAWLDGAPAGTRRSTA